MQNYMLNEPHLHDLYNNGFNHNYEGLYGGIKIYYEPTKTHINVEPFEPQLAWIISEEVT